MMLRRIASWLAPLVVFALVFWTHDASYMRNATDTKWAVHVAMSLVKQHDANLDEYRDLLASNGNFAIEDVGGHLYSLYPLGAPILAAPLVYVAECYRSFENRPSLENEIAHQIPYDLNRTCASFIVALAAMIVFSFVRLRHGSVVAAITTIVLAFGTAAWSTASRGLWQHGPSLLAIALAIYCAERAAKNDRWIVVAALPISFAFLARPSNALVIVLFTVYVAICHRRRLLGYGSIGAAIAVCFFWYSWRTYGHLVPTYYRPSALAELSARVVTEVDFPKAAAAQLISPGRGLFLFSPVLAFCVYGMARTLRREPKNAFAWFAVAAILAHWVTISTVRIWWGGFCFGPRMFSDVLPLFVYFVPAALIGFRSFTTVRARSTAHALFAALAAVSIVINYRGANLVEPERYNFSPDNIDFEGRKRLWDYHDIQWMRGLE